MEKNGRPTANPWSVWAISAASAAPALHVLEDQPAQIGRASAIKASAAGRMITAVSRMPAREEADARPSGLPVGPLRRHTGQQRGEDRDDEDGVREREDDERRGVGGDAALLRRAGTG